MDENVIIVRKKGTAATRAKNKWNTANYDRLYPYVKKGKKELYTKAAELGGYSSLNEFLEKVLDEKAGKILGLDLEKPIK